jgi:mannose-6-phosphate isomerase-like protein (cupin superfamily)
MRLSTESPAASGLLVPPGRGRTFGAGAGRLQVKVGSEAGGQFGIIEGVLPPGAGPSPHRHQRYDEAFYVLEGAIEYFIGDEWVLATAGTCVYAPAGLIHGFRNSGVSEARQLIIAAPAEAFEMVEALHSVTPDQLGAVLERYATEFVRDP